MLLLWKLYYVWVWKVQRSCVSQYWRVRRNWVGTELCFEKWHGEFGKIWVNTRKSQNLHIMGSFWEKYIKVELKKFQKSYVSWHWRVMQYLKKNLTIVFKNDIRNLINFHESSRESENFHFDGLALSKAYKVLDEKAQKGNVSSHLRVIQRKANSWEIFIFCVMQEIWSS